MVKYVLHFDINKTILMSDAASNKDLRAVVNGAIAESVRGTRDRNVWTADAGSTIQGHVGTRGDSMHYGTFATQRLEEVRNLVKKGLATQDLESDTQKYYKQIKAEFTDKGRPGERYKPQFEHALAVLASHTAAQTPLNGFDHNPNAPVLLPSFLGVVDHLRTQNIPAMLVFRTFGTDLNVVCEQFTECLLATGDWTLPESKETCTEKTGHISKSTHLDMTKLEGYKGKELLPQEILMGFKMWLEDPETGTPFTSTDRTGQSYTLRVKFVRDNYERWANSTEAGNAGKPFFVEEAADRQTHSIFFDDNLETEFSHIVAAYTTTGELFIQGNRRAVPTKT